MHEQRVISFPPKTIEQVAAVMITINNHLCGVRVSVPSAAVICQKLHLPKLIEFKSISLSVEKHDVP